LAIALVHSVAFAQVSATLTALSDYRYRGVSFSDDRPAAQFTIGYDDPSGWYAGLFASTIRFAATGQSGGQALVYAGYAHRLPSGLTIEAGADYASYRIGGQTYDYPELYAGVAFDNVTARLHYARRYYAGNTDTLYAEIDGAIALHDRARLVAHVGALHSARANADYPYYPTTEWTGDAKVGVAFDVETFVVQLAWVGVTSNAAYVLATGSRRNNVVLSVSKSF
jgi:uncharacterized protein (TIGR02001 family)